MKSFIHKSLAAALFAGAGVAAGVNLDSPAFAQSIPPPPPSDPNANDAAEADVGPSLTPPNQDDPVDDRSASDRNSDQDNLPPPPRDPGSARTGSNEPARAEIEDALPAEKETPDETQPVRRRAESRDRARADDVRDEADRVDSRVPSGESEADRRQPLKTDRSDRDSRDASSDTNRRPMLGVSFQSQADALVIERVAPNSPAALAGLRRGDRIVGLNGRIVQDVDAFTGTVSNVTADEAVELTYLRNGRLFTQEVRFTGAGSVNADSDHGFVEGEGRRVYRPDLQEEPVLPMQRGDFQEVLPMPPKLYIVPPWRFDDDDWDDDD